MNDTEKRAPVQGYAAGIPWSMHLRAYDVYCKRYGAQPALIDLEGRNCRGGFGCSELDMFIPGWREELSELTQLRAALHSAETARDEAQERSDTTAGQLREARTNEAHVRAALASATADVARLRVIYADGYCERCSRLSDPLTRALEKCGVPTGAEDWQKTYGPEKVLAMRDYETALRRLLITLSEADCPPERIQQARESAQHYLDCHAQRYRERNARFQAEQRAKEEAADAARKEAP